MFLDQASRMFIPELVNESRGTSGVTADPSSLSYIALALEHVVRLTDSLTAAFSHLSYLLFNLVIFSAFCIWTRRCYRKAAKADLHQEVEHLNCTEPIRTELHYERLTEVLHKNVLGSHATRSQSCSLGSMENQNVNDIRHFVPDSSHHA